MQPDLVEPLSCLIATYRKLPDKYISGNNVIISLLRLRDTHGTDIQHVTVPKRYPRHATPVSIDYEWTSVMF